jgi:hypothetical protein
MRFALKTLKEAAALDGKTAIISFYVTWQKKQPGKCVGQSGLQSANPEISLIWGIRVEGNCLIYNSKWLCF